jgi:hypothetical protein
MKMHAIDVYNHVADCMREIGLMSHPAFNKWKETKNRKDWPSGNMPGSYIAFAKMLEIAMDGGSSEEFNAAAVRAYGLADNINRVGLLKFYRIYDSKYKSGVLKEILKAFHDLA